MAKEKSCPRITGWPNTGQWPWTDETDNSSLATYVHSQERGHCIAGRVALYHKRDAFRNRAHKLGSWEAGFVGSDGEMHSENVTGLFEQLSGLSGY